MRKVNLGSTKWLDFPDDKKFAVLENIEQMTELLERQRELYGELRQSLLHHWMKGEPVTNLVNFTEASFERLVRRYFKAIEDGEDQFKINIDDQDCEFLVTYVKYLIEYMEPQMQARAANETIFKSKMSKLRRDHMRVMNDKALRNG